MTENEPTSDRCRDNYFHDKLTAEILSKLNVFFLMHDGVTCI